MANKSCLAMILAGGQGSRLGALTKNIAKPAVNFGGKYRIIDFTLSNCIHSGINTVGVLTQYQPLELNTYIGNGQPWDLDRMNGGVYVLPPFVKAEHGEWYKGTANAIYQNIEFIEKFKPEYILVLSGDHIYKMDYGKMLNYHKENNAAATISVIGVPWDEASRFGIMNTDKNGKIIEFEEKPKEPKSNLASMGIYIFNWKQLKKYLIVDENNVKSANDFGKNIIPSMLASGEKMVAYKFDGYWKDVGTISSLWEANMDLIEDPSEFDLDDENWKIFARSPVTPPHYVSPKGKLKRSMVSEGCSVMGKVDHSILFNSVRISEGSKIIDSIILPGASIGKNCIIRKAVIGSNTVIKDNVEIGCKDGCDLFINNKICSDDITLIGQDIIIEEGIKICPNSMVDRTIDKSLTEIQDRVPLKEEAGLKIS